MDNLHPPIVIIAGRSGSGKTTLMERLIPELKKKGLRVGSIKHHKEGDFDIDHPGKDSWRHKKAGAEKTVISSPTRIGLVMDADHDHRPDELIHFFHEMDIVLVEGHKEEALPKVEIFRPELHDSPSFLKDPNLIAVMTNSTLATGVPVLDLNDVTGLADLLIRHFYLVKIYRGKPKT
jgi:molybdopterin-guanine dinucleotide biosynthesis protein B